MNLVVIESPYAGDVEANLAYVRRAMGDCLFRGEAPFASHALYTQAGVLDDTVARERRLGIDAGLAWGRQAGFVAVYIDLGISDGMRLGVAAAQARGATILLRALDREVTAADRRAVFG